MQQRKKGNAFFLTATILISILLSACTNSSGTATTSPSSGTGSSASVSTSTSGNNTSSSTSAFISDTNLNPPGQFPVAKEKVSLKIGLGQNPNVKDYKDNLYTKLLEEQANVDLSFDMYPSNEATQKVELMVAAGGNELPDILVMGLSDKAAANYGKNKMIVPLNDYYENASYYIAQGLEKVKDKEITKMFTSPDGNIYTIPQYAESLVNEYNLLLWLEDAWLKKLGIAYPTTTDEFETMLRAFKKDDPNGNGKADEIPFMGSNSGGFSGYLDFIMSAFVYSDSSKDYMTLENGKIGMAYTTSQWQEGLRYLKRLCEEGLLSPLSFTQDETQFKQVASNVDTTLVGSMVCASPSFLPPEDARRGEYKICGPLTGPQGKKNVVYKPTTTANNLFITKNCKTPELAFRVGDIMWSEEATIHNRWGKVGVDWEVPSADTPSIFESLGYKALIKPILVWGAVQSSHWQRAAADFRTYEIAAGMTADNNVLEAEKGLKLNLYIDNRPSELIYKIIYTGEEMDQITETLTTLKTFVAESTAMFITGGSDIEKDWDKYLSEIEKMGLPNVIKIVQSAYDRMQG